MTVAALFAHNETGHRVPNDQKRVIFPRAEGQKVTAVAMKKLLADKFGLSPEHFHLRAVRAYQFFDFFASTWKYCILSASPLEREAEVPVTSCEFEGPLQEARLHEFVNFCICKCVNRTHCPEKGDIA